MGDEDQEREDEPDQVERVVPDVELDGPTAGPPCGGTELSGDGRPIG